MWADGGDGENCKSQDYVEQELKQKGKQNRGVTLEPFIKGLFAQKVCTLHLYS